MNILIVLLGVVALTVSVALFLLVREKRAIKALLPILGVLLIFIGSSFTIIFIVSAVNQNNG